MHTSWDLLLCMHTQSPSLSSYTFFFASSTSLSKHSPASLTKWPHTGTTQRWYPLASWQHTVLPKLEGNGSAPFCPPAWLLQHLGWREEWKTTPDLGQRQEALLPPTFWTCLLKKAANGRKGWKWKHQDEERWIFLLSPLAPHKALAFQFPSPRLLWSQV